MFYTDAYVKKDGKIDTVKILELQRTSAKAEYQGKKFDSTYAFFCMLNKSHCTL